MSGLIIVALIVVGVLYYINKKGINYVSNKQKEYQRQKESYKSNDYKSSANDWTGGSQRQYRNNYEKYSQRSPFDEYNDFDKQSNVIIDTLKDVRNDFVNAPYSDKMSVEGNDIIIRYIFENGRTVTLKTSLIMVDSYHGVTKNYNIGAMHASLFMDFFKNLAKQSRERKGGAKFNKQTADRTKYTEEQIKYQEMFWKLKEINDLRMQQLNKMSKTDPDRAALVNEVNVVKRKMKAAFIKSGLKTGATK